MTDCAACSLLTLERENDGCLHTNRPGGLELTRIAMELCCLTPGAMVLDVANGAGGSLHYLAEEKGFKMVGLDLSYQMLKFGQTDHPGLRLIQANCERIPIKSASQNAILMECAFSLSGSADLVLSEFNRILLPGGKLILSDVYIREICDPLGMECLPDNTCLSGAVAEQAIRESILKNNFQIITWQDHTPLFKQWLGKMVFKLGSLEMVYRQFTHNEVDAKTLMAGLGNQLKLGYYLMIAQKAD